MKVAVVGFDRSILEKGLKQNGFTLDKLKPDIVISFGGDGSALFAEQLYPGIPRLMIKHSKVCETCNAGSVHEFSPIFEKLKKKQYKVVKKIKLEGIVGNDQKKMLVGLNEVNIAHAVPIKAIRFDVFVDNKLVAADLIGDGVVIATPYGSTAYFKAITGRTFSKGIGIAFNNVNQNIKYRFAPESAEIKVKLRRGPALMCADNNTTMVPLRNEDIITVRKSKEKAKIIELRGEKGKISL
jgi:NAD+ kinase